MDSASLLALHLQELKRRFPEAAKKHYDFTDPIFILQNQILADKSRFQGWQATRRGAKSTTFGKKACDVACNKPGAKVLYLALTLDSAKGILWDSIDKELTEKKVKYRGYEREGRFELENGSQIRFFGVDSNYKEMKKILGQAFDLVGIDECGSMTIDMEALVMHMILAALSDREGTLVLLGTAENIPNTFFQKVMDGLETSLPWKLWKWTTEKNPYMARQFKQDMEMILINNPLAKLTSWFRTHWLNEWCADDDLLIIRHNENINETTYLPRGKVFYCLGVDLGFNDASSFTVCAYSSSDPNLYVIESFKVSGMDFSDVAGTIKRLYGSYDIHKVVVDGANKQGVEELRKRHGLQLNAAEKTDKATFLRALSDDYIQGRILVHKDKSKHLIDEQSKLMWLKDAEKEDPRCENHCNDSLLYAWRECRNYLFKPEVSEWKTPDQRMEDQFLKESQLALEEREELNLLF